MQPLDPFSISFSDVHLIEASAGTGKTYNIESLYVRAIAEENKTVDEILVVTYTEAATKELRDRLTKRLRQSIQVLRDGNADSDSFLRQLYEHTSDKKQAIQRLQTAIHSFDEAAIYTIHGFCNHVLQERAFQSGAPFEMELIGDDTEIAGELVDDYWRNWVNDVSAKPLHRPLLKLMLAKGYSPDKLTDQLVPYIGKSYLILRPKSIDAEQVEENLYKLSNLFGELKTEWHQSKEEIARLLLSDRMSGRSYREGWLSSWMQCMDDWLSAEVTPINCFDKLSRFSQSFINDSLTKKSRKKGLQPPTHPVFKLVDDYIETANFLQNFDIIFKQRLFQHLKTKLRERKDELQVFSYDDLLSRLKEALYDKERGPNLQRNLRKTYSVALVDEFQDTDPVQYDIFRAIYDGAADAALFMIGDPKQSIYSFRGADIFAYLKAKNNAPADKIFSLDRNYRSVPSLIEGVNALFSSHPNPFILEDISYRPVKSGKAAGENLTIDGQEASPLELRNLTAEEDEPLNKTDARERSAKDTASQIYQLLYLAGEGRAKIGEKSVQSRDIAVLVYSHWQAELISKALSERGIKSVKHSRDSVFKTDEARELYTILKAVIEPSDESLVITALATSIFGYKGSELYELRAHENAWAAKLEQFADWHDQWQSHGFAYMFRQLMQREMVAETVIRKQDGERVLTNLLHLSELMQRTEQHENAGLHSLLKWLLKKRKEDYKDNEEEQLRLESDENLVNVVTMHYSKGLEYPIVFCPFLWEASRNADYGRPLVYHDENDKSRAYLDLNGKEDPQRDQKRFLQTKEELAEGVRLAYVGITRAKYKCVLNWAHAKKSAHSPLGFLLIGKERAFKSLRNDISSNNKYKEIDSSLATQAITELATNPEIAVGDLTNQISDDEKINSDTTDEQLKVKTFKRDWPLPTGAALSSFSSLVRAEHEDFEPDLYQYYDDVIVEQEELKQMEQRNAFTFPKGPGPGTAIHHIFEDVLFSDAKERSTIISERLRQQDIGPRWDSVAAEIIQQTMQKRLLPDMPNFNLAAVKQENMIPEMEFYYPSGELQLATLLDIIRPEAPASVNGFADEGFLKGFIDLTLCFNGKYYITDYKTNYLGDTHQDYGAASLETEIKEKMYDLQYHLYLVALHRFLKKRLSNYNYEQHIGGVFYLFLRGINEEGNQGIYFDCPPEARIHNLDSYLKGEAK